jgi:predicted metal-dependent hydrolase
MTETITLLSSSGKEIPYTLRVSTRARRLRITVSASGVTVTLPKGVPLREAERFLRHQEAWVLAQLEKVSKQNKPPSCS